MSNKEYLFNHSHIHYLVECVRRWKLPLLPWRPRIPGSIYLGPNPVSNNHEKTNIVPKPLQFSIPTFPISHFQLRQRPSPPIASMNNPFKEPILIVSIKVGKCRPIASAVPTATCVFNLITLSGLLQHVFPLLHCYFSLCRFICSAILWKLF